MKSLHALLVLLLFAGLTGGCSTVQRGADSVKRSTANVWNDIFGAKKERNSSPSRSSGGSGSSRSTSEKPPALESTPQEYVGS